MSSVTLAWALTDEGLYDLPSPIRFVLVALCDHANPDGRNAFPSVDRLCKMTGLSPRTVQNALRSLEERGLIEPGDDGIVAAHIKRGDRRPRNYTVRMDRARSGAQEMHPVDSDPQNNGAHEMHPVDAHGVQDMHERGAGDAPEPRTRTTTTNPSSVLVTSDVPSDVATTGLALVQMPSEPERLCGILADNIEAAGFSRPTVTAGWVAAMERMLRIDGRTVEEVEGCLRWLDTNEFWRLNVRSPQKLREQYERLRAEAARTRRTSAADTQAQSLSVIQQVLREEGAL